MMKREELLQRIEEEGKKKRWGEMRCELDCIPKGMLNDGNVLALTLTSLSCWSVNLIFKLANRLF